VVNKNSLIRTNVFLSKQEKLALKKLGQQLNISASELLRRIVDKAFGIEIAPVKINLPVLDLKKQTVPGK
jgi:hypothetical protein